MRSRERRIQTKERRGGRNLLIMGLISTLIAVCTTSISLAIYHNSGDIYLDRSRPGYLPDEEEIEDESEKEEEEYDFSRNGKLDEADLVEFLERLQVEIQSINEYEKPFGEEVLSDERLGIPVDEGEVPEI